MSRWRLRDRAEKDDRFLRLLACCLDLLVSDRAREKDDRFLRLLACCLDLLASQQPALVHPSRLSAADFEECVRFDNSDGNAPSTHGALANSQVKIYAPRVFASLRHHAGISNTALTRAFANQPVTRDTASRGRSGTAFFRSQDGAFLLKSSPKSETKCLRAMLRDYHAHVTEAGGSYLVPLLALLKVRALSGRRHCDFFLLIAHIAPSAAALFDIKGCLQNRHSDIPDGKLLKDRDLLESRLKLILNVEDRTALVTQLRKDLEFLKDRGLIDYSLLIAVVHVKNGGRRGDVEVNEEEPLCSRDVASLPVRLCINGFIDSARTSAHPVLQQLDKLEPNALRLQLSVIDFLTSFGPYQRIARLLKRLRYGPHAVMSTAPPEEFSSRLMAFLENFLTS